ncbi:MAG: hypothetical protein AB4368_22900 [Xenococcaceae cyanobacterium]
MNSPKVTAINNRPLSKKFRRSIADILADFSKPIPARLVSKKPVFSRQNGKLTKTGEVNYVSWSNYIKLLDYFAPGFDWEIRTHYLHNQIVVVEGRLTIKAEEGDFIREATGYEEIGNDGYGNAVNNAEASALRRCCAKFQLGLQFWHK